MLVAADDLVVEREMHVYEAVVAWCAANSPSPSTVEALLGKIRFAWLGLDFLTGRAEQQPLLQPHAWLVTRSLAESVAGVRNERTAARHSFPLLVRVTSAGKVFSGYGNAPLLFTRFEKFVRLAWAEEARVGGGDTGKVPEFHLHSSGRNYVALVRLDSGQHIFIDPAGLEPIDAMHRHHKVFKGPSPQSAGGETFPALEYPPTEADDDIE